MDEREYKFIKGCTYSEEQESPPGPDWDYMMAGKALLCGSNQGNGSP